MLNYNQLSKKPQVFKNSSGLGVQEFDTLNSHIQDKYIAFEQKKTPATKQKKSKRRRPPIQPLTNRQTAYASNVLPPLFVI
jgi:hypothetical protein